ncbi:TetR/AcrR family transcriptional regulator [Butyrivibrio sp. INlla16]|uniref:TetR/AcrR family transcriptional regulator n=1 Tax=Butyrivibrio sp. INlla16 TaxID=1520807 RepID=UPI0008830ECD|nr:TetR/AcrR family transcriptional regulator [Butyrivibrio sp. INlla16]SDB50115.1 transcriptional regulator, TetR family [Butyrivibrio sp. INlla16]
MENNELSELAKRDILRLNNEESKKMTRECFQMALIYLMGEKSFDKITITDLVRRSGVSRTAFYRNYSSKEEILSDIKENLIERVSVIFDSVMSGEDLHKWFLGCFDLIEKEKKMIDLLLKANISVDTLFEGKSFLEKFYPAKTTEQKYYLVAAEAAFQDVLLKWFKDGMQESKEEMSEICVTVFSGFRQLMSP